MMKTNMKMTKTLIAAAMTMTLAACGGGGGGGSTTTPVNNGGTPTNGGGTGGTPTTTTFSVTAKNVPNSIDESTSSSIEIQFSGANGDVTGSVEEKSKTGLTVSLSNVTSDGATVNIDVPELENNASGVVNVSFTDSDDQTVTYAIETALINRSGIEALAVYEVTATGAGTFVNLEPEHELHERLEKILAMLGVSTEDIPVFPQSLDLKARADLINYSNDRAEVVDAYGNGEITETELKETTSEILALAAKYAQPVNTELEKLVTLSSGAVPDLELNGVYPDRESGVAISQFVGNELMGSYSTGWVWTFDGEYEFMAQLTQNSATCQVAQ